MRRSHLQSSDAEAGQRQQRTRFGHAVCFLALFSQGRPPLLTVNLRLSDPLELLLFSLRLGKAPTLQLCQNVMADLADRETGQIAKPSLAICLGGEHPG